MKNKAEQKEQPQTLTRDDRSQRDELLEILTQQHIPEELQYTEPPMSTEEKIQVALDVLCSIGRVIQVIFIILFHALPFLLGIFVVMMFLGLMLTCPPAALGLAAIVILALQDANN